MESACASGIAGGGGARRPNAVRPPQRLQDPNRPIGIFLFRAPGVGKTELARALAEFSSMTEGDGPARMAST